MVRSVPFVLLFLIAIGSTIELASAQVASRRQSTLFDPQFQLEPFDSPTREMAVHLAGKSRLARSSIRIEGGSETVVATSGGDRRFEVVVPLRANRVNRLFLTEIDRAAKVYPPIPVQVIQDTLAPEVFIDFPEEGAELTTNEIAVVGRLSDNLSGFMDLTVKVNGVLAAVDVGIGTNGTFEAQKIVLRRDKPTPIEVQVLDAVGNVTRKVIQVQQVDPGGPRMFALGGGGQSAPVRERLDEPIVVQVVHPDGRPFVDKIVNFEIIRNDGLLGFDDQTPGTSSLLQVRTDNAGIAAAFWTLGGTSGCGSNRVRVSSTSVSDTVLFCATGERPAPTQINIGSGNNQRVQSGGHAFEPLRVWVSDGCNGVPGVPVVFQVERGSGRVNGQSQVEVVTSATGHAEVDFLLGPERGNQSVSATYEGNPNPAARFTLFGLQRTPGAPTAFQGVVLDNASQPIEGTTATLLVDGVEYGPVFSDVNGRFRFDSVGFGPADLYVDGSTATRVGGRPLSPGERYPELHYETLIIPESVNSLPMPVLLPVLKSPVVRYDGTQNVKLTVEGIEGLEMTVEAGTTVTKTDGSIVGPDNPIDLSLDHVHPDDIPMPMPDGAAPLFSWTLQPGGTHFDPPVQVIYPNMAPLPPNSLAFFLSFDHDTGRFEIVASGHVTEDGSQIVTDPGSGISKAGWGCNCPPYSVTGECENCVVEIAGPEELCVIAQEERTFTASGLPAEGQYSWSGGTPVGPTDQSTYRARFMNPNSVTTVRVTFRCETETGTTSDSDTVDVLVLEGDGSYHHRVAAGKLGDVITVQLPTTDLENFRELSQSNDRGFVAQVDDWEQVLRDEGRFYFVPSEIGNSNLTLRADCRSEEVEIEVLFESIGDDYSTSGPDSVTGGDSKLSIYREQQRLRYFGFPGRSGSPISVDGLRGSNTAWAIGLFNAATSNTGHDPNADSIDVGYANAANAPRWQEAPAGGTGWNNIDADDHDWGTSWAIEVLNAAGAQNQGTSLETNDLSLPQGGDTPDHSSHEAGMDIDIETPSTDSATRPFYKTLEVNGVQYIAARTDTDPTADDHVVCQEDGSFTACAKTGDLTNAVRHTLQNYNDQAILSGIAELIVDNPDATGYNIENIRKQLAALTGVSSTPSGAGVDKILYNDPRTWDLAQFSTGHGGHIHVDVSPPASRSMVSPSATLTQSPGISRKGDESEELDSSWTVTVAGQSISVDPNGHFLVPNFAAPDSFGPGGPGTAPDFLSDDFLQVVGVSTVTDPPRYVFSERFQIRQGETFTISDLTFTDSPPPLPVALSIDAQDVLIPVGLTTQLQTWATLGDGSQSDVTPRSSWTVYRSSNPQIATVDEDGLGRGLVTGHAPGRVLITAVNGGVSAIKRLTVTVEAIRTTIEGYVQLEDGTPVIGAEVSVVGLDLLAVSEAPNGLFRMSDVSVPSELEELTVYVRWDSGQEILDGRATELPPVPSGVTDAGVVTLTPVDCEFEQDLGLDLNHSDDDFTRVTFQAGFSFPFYGRTWTEVYVNSNGNLTFGGGDTTFDPPVPSGVVSGLPRISPYFIDLDPSFGLGDFARQTEDRFVVTYFHNPEFSNGGDNTIQVVLFEDGRIHFIYAGITALGVTRDGSVAVSPGGNPVLQSVDFSVESPFSSGPGEAVLENFNSESLFDLDFSCVQWSPNASGGFDVGVVPCSRCEAFTDAQGAVVGIVRDGQGRPVPDCEVIGFASTDGRFFQTARTKEDGSFELRGFPVPSGVTVVAYPAGAEHSSTGLGVLRLESHVLDVEVTPPSGDGKD